MTFSSKLNNHFSDSVSPILLVTSSGRNELNKLSQTRTGQHIAFKGMQKIDTNSTESAVLTTSAYIDHGNYGDHGDSLTKKLIIKPPDDHTLNQESPASEYSSFNSQVTTGQKMDKPAALEKSKPTIKPGPNDNGLTNLQLNNSNSHIGEDDSNAVKVNYSQKIRLGSETIGFGNLLEKIIEKSQNITDKNATYINESTSFTEITTHSSSESTQSPITKYCHDYDGDYKTTKEPCITVNPGNSGKTDTDFANKVKEVPFKVQVSPDINNVRNV